MKKIALFNSHNFVKQKIHNFDCQYFYAQTLAYKEFLKLATLSKKQWQTVEPQSSYRSIETGQKIGGPKVDRK